MICAYAVRKEIVKSLKLRTISYNFILNQLYIILSDFVRNGTRRFSLGLSIDVLEAYTSIRTITIPDLL
jgi:hypothetical protein